MSGPPRRARAVLFVVSSTCAFAAAPAPAVALNPIKPVCSVGGLISGVVGKACTAVQRSGRLLDAGKQLATGHVGGAVKAAFGTGARSVASKATTALAFTAIVAAALGGARFELNETGKVLGRTTTPQLGSTWFSTMYWRVAGIAAVLTLPFLFAACAQALLHSDISLLLRAALGYLPLAMLAVGIAAPLAMLLLAASDQMSAVVSSAAGDASAHFLTRASRDIGIVSALSSPFVALFIGLIAIAGGLVLWIELLIRAAAVYVVVLMLPLAFAALVWPARRVWAVRAVELLVALIVSKFAIVAVLALGGAALGASESHSITGMLGGVVLLVMGAFAPWALVRLIPLAEIAAGAASSLSGGARHAGTAVQRADAEAHDRERWATRTAEMRREAEATERRSDAPEDAAESIAQRLPGSDHPRPPARDAESTAAPGAPGATAPDPTSNETAPSPPDGAAESSPDTPPTAQTAARSPTSPDRQDPSFLPLPEDNGDGPIELVTLDDGRSPGQAPTEAPGDVTDPRPPVQPPEDGHL